MKELINVQIETKEGINVVSSRVIAKELEKEHRNILRDLDKIMKELVCSTLSTPPIIESTYINEQNKQEYREYLLTKDGFTLYMFNIQGYNDFKMAYINKFNEMEKALKEQNKPQLPQDYLSALKALVASEEEKARLLQEQKENAPKVLFANSVSTSKTTILVREMAKILKQNGVDTGEKKFYKWLRENGYLVKAKCVDYNMPTQRSMNLGLFEIKETTINHSNGTISISRTPKVTGIGQQYFINKFLNK